MKKSNTNSRSKRTTLSTAKRKEAFVNAFVKCRGIISTACRRVGVDRSTYYQWMERDEAFASSIQEALEEQVDFVEDSLLTLIESGDTTATIFYLKTKAKQRGYSERLELTGKEGKDLFANMTDEELAKEIELLRQRQDPE